MTTKQRSSAVKFLDAHGTDATDVMAALDAAGIEFDQDWQNESTVWTFEDGSRIKISEWGVELWRRRRGLED